MLEVWWYYIVGYTILILLFKILRNKNVYVSNDHLNHLSMDYLGMEYYGVLFL